MKSSLKYWFLYAVLVFPLFFLINKFWSLSQYGSDNYYFWGLSKYLFDGKFENSTVFWPIYPKLLSFLLIPIHVFFPKAELGDVLVTAMATIFALGPILFILIHKNQSVKRNFLFFFFSISGFWIIDYVVGISLAPQTYAYLLIPIFPALFFSQKKYANFLAYILIIILYLLHSMTAFIILVTTALCFFWKECRQKSTFILVLLSPFLIIKILHLLMLLTGFDFPNLPFNDLFEKINLQSSWKYITKRMVYFDMYNFFLTGIPFFFWILFLGLKNKKPEVRWYLTLSGICLFIVFFYKYWHYLLPVPWPLDRYFGYFWLSISLMLPYLFYNWRINVQKKFVYVAIFFIVFQVFTAFKRETYKNKDFEGLIAWTYSLKEEIAASDDPILFMYKPGITYAYGIFSPLDIYFNFSVDDATMALNLNLRSEDSKFIWDTESPEKIMKKIEQKNFSLIIYDSKFDEYFSLLKSDSSYELISKKIFFTDKVFAYKRID